MTNTEALDILEQYQAWRHGADTEMLEPKDIGKAIDVAIDALKRTQWQPIETARKSNNRKHVILFGDGSSFSKCVFIGFCDGQKWFPFDGNDDVYPTHWMPLPPAP